MCWWRGLVRSYTTNSDLREQNFLHLRLYLYKIFLEEKYNHILDYTQILLSVLAVCSARVSVVDVSPVPASGESEQGALPEVVRGTSAWMATGSSRCLLTVSSREEFLVSDLIHSW